MTAPQTASHLTALAAPYLARRDADGFMKAVSREFSTVRLIGILKSGTADAARIAAWALGLCAGMNATPALASALHHRDARVAWAAEAALWSIWFRSAGPAAREALFHAVARRDQDRCIGELSDLVRRYPTFAEAYNQRALAHFVRGRYAEAHRDYARAVHLNPHHFAAFAGRGNCEANLGRLDDALASYHLARSIHPRLEGLRQSLRQLRILMHRRPSPRLRTVDAV